MANPIHLETEAQAFADAAAKPPFLYNLGPQKGRAALNSVQSGAENLPLVDIEDLVIKGGPGGQVSIRIVKPQSAPAMLPIILYTHGAGWVFGDKLTHDRLIRKLAVGAGAAVVFTNYSLSPEAKYPTALEECYAALKWVAENGTEYGLDSGRIAAAGDSVGGNLTIAITLLAKERGGPAISQQLLFYPVTNAHFDTESYLQFAEGFHLRREGMMWFWDQYTSDINERHQVTASPLRASIEELRNLPPALIITAEADVLRDEGEAYGNKLREAGVPVTTARFQGTIHDFVLLNSLANTPTARGAMMLATTWLKEGFAVTEAAFTAN